MNQEAESEQTSPESIDTKEKYSSVKLTLKCDDSENDSSDSEDVSELE
jgi:hypothetical protein